MSQSEKLLTQDSVIQEGIASAPLPPLCSSRTPWASVVGEGSKGRASERWQGRFHVCFYVSFICSSIVCTLHDSTEPESACSFEK